MATKASRPAASPAARSAKVSKGASFGPIKTRRAFEEVCDQVRREVALGRLVPGDRLPPEREFAEQLGVSRTAIREAMRSLENAGLVQCHQGMGGGAFIKEQNSNAMTQAVSDLVMLGQIPSSSLTEARLILTDQAIRLACERATEEDFLAMEQDIDHLEELTSKGNFTRRNSYIIEFYRILAQATHNPVLVMLVESLSEVTRTLLAKASLVPRSDVIGVRRRVVRLMRGKKANQAVAEMRAHLLRLGTYLEEHARKHANDSTQQLEAAWQQERNAAAVSKRRGRLGIVK